MGYTWVIYGAVYGLYVDYMRGEMWYVLKE